jgi:hypothetical protein
LGPDTWRRKSFIDTRGSEPCQDPLPAAARLVGAMAGKEIHRARGSQRRRFPVAEWSTKTKVTAILIAICFVVAMALYSYFISDTVRTRITDAQMTKVDGRFMIATEYRPFVNYDAKYRLKVNSGTIQNEAIRLKGREVMIKKYGWRLPLFSMYENVVSIK